MWQFLKEDCPFQEECMHTIVLLCSSTCCLCATFGMYLRTSDHILTVEIPLWSSGGSYALLPLVSQLWCVATSVKPHTVLQHEIISAKHPSSIWAIYIWQKRNSLCIMSKCGVVYVTFFLAGYVTHWWLVATSWALDIHQIYQDLFFNGAFWLRLPWHRLLSEKGWVLWFQRVKDRFVSFVAKFVPTIVWHICTRTKVAKASSSANAYAPSGPALFSSWNLRSHVQLQVEMLPYPLWVVRPLKDHTQPSSLAHPTCTFCLLCCQIKVVWVYRWLMHFHHTWLYQCPTDGGIMEGGNSSVEYPTFAGPLTEAIYSCCECSTGYFCSCPIAHAAALDQLPAALCMMCHLSPQRVIGTTSAHLHSAGPFL